ncbi:MAG: tetratricopeptide repeat protein [Chloroflexota bacterium]
MSRQANNVDSHNQDDVAQWRASFLEKARRAGRRVQRKLTELESTSLESTDTALENTVDQSQLSDDHTTLSNASNGSNVDGQRAYLWQAIEVNYHFTKDWRIVVDCALTGHPHMVRRGPWAQWGELLLLALDAAQQLEDISAEATLYTHLGYLRHRQGLWHDAESYYEEAEELYMTLEGSEGDNEEGNRKDTGDVISKFGLPRLWRLFSEQYREQGDWAQATFYAEQAHVAQESNGDRLGLAATYSTLGFLAWRRAVYDDALQWFQKSLAIPEVVNDPELHALTHSRLGNVYSSLNKLSKALHHYTKSSQIAKREGDDGTLNIVLGNLGTLYGEMGELNQSVKIFHQARTIAERCGDLHGVALVHMNLAETLRDLGRMAESLDECNTAVHLLQQLDIPFDLGLALTNRSELFRLIGDYDAAQRSVNEARDMLTEMIATGMEYDRHVQGAILYEQGELWAVAGRISEALAQLQEAFDMSQEADDHYLQVRAGKGLGAIYVQQRAWTQIEPLVQHLMELGIRLERIEWQAFAHQLRGDIAWSQTEVNQALTSYRQAYHCLNTARNDRNSQLMQTLIQHVEGLVKQCTQTNDVNSTQMDVKNLLASH